jgi:hypothetical protein
MSQSIILLSSEFLEAATQLALFCAALQLSRAGYLVAKPFGENCRYDLIIDDGRNLFRVQVKTGRLRKSAIEWNCCSTHTHRNGPSTRPYIGQVEFFGVYCPQLEEAYLVPITQTSRRECSLRVRAPKNGQTRRIRWAHDFSISSAPLQKLIRVGAESADVVTGLGSSAPS